MKPKERFLSKVKVIDGCWVWQAGLNNRGYGQFHWNYRNWKAHRASLALHGRAKELEKPGLVVDHICLNRKCVNPSHLRVVTPMENAHNSIVGVGCTNAIKTHCPGGHPYDNLNTGTSVYKGWRVRRCRTCNRERMRKYRLLVRH